VSKGASADEAEQRVRFVVAGLLATGTRLPDIQLVAETIGMRVRTLQRRLRGIGSTYAGVIQRTRYATAQELLKDPQRTIGEIARMLGYSDHAHFTRAFQRWTGLTPRDFRRGDRPIIGRRRPSD
jgi:AraC-like DNA-binding protein